MVATTVRRRPTGQQGGYPTVAQHVVVARASSGTDVEVVVVHVGVAATVGVAAATTRKAQADGAYTRQATLRIAIRACPTHPRAVVAGLQDAVLPQFSPACCRADVGGNLEVRPVAQHKVARGCAQHGGAVGTREIGSWTGVDTHVNVDRACVIQQRHKRHAGGIETSDVEREPGDDRLVVTNQRPVGAHRHSPATIAAAAEVTHADALAVVEASLREGQCSRSVLTSPIHGAVSPTTGHVIHVGVGFEAICGQQRHGVPPLGGGGSTVPSIVIGSSRQYSTSVICSTWVSVESTAMSSASRRFSSRGSQPSQLPAALG